MKLYTRLGKLGVMMNWLDKLINERMIVENISENEAELKTALDYVNHKDAVRCIYTSFLPYYRAECALAFLEVHKAFNNTNYYVESIKYLAKAFVCSDSFTPTGEQLSLSGIYSSDNTIKLLLDYHRSISKEIIARNAAIIELTKIKKG